MTVPAAVAALLTAIRAEVAGVAAFRAVVTAVDGHLVQIKRIGESAGGGEKYASCGRFVLYVNDVVLCIPVGGKPVVLDVIQRAAAATPTLTLLAAAGTTASSAINGRDDAMQAQVVPGGTGIAAGSFVTVNFAATQPSTSYDVLVAPNSSAARTLGGVVGATSRGTGGFDLATATALTSGSTYQFGLRIVPYA